MKTGLLFFQSIASSALRSGGRPSSYTVGRQIISERRGNNINGATYLIATAAGIGGVLCASSSSGTCSSYKSTAMCSSKDNDSTSPNGNRKSIDEPDNTPQHNPLLPFPEGCVRHDTYNGITLDLTTLLSQETESTINTEFGDMLGKALGIWKEEKRKGIWLKIPTSHSHLISPATKHGFDFQHAEPGYCVLTKWLPQGSVSRLPNGPTHQVIKCFNMMKVKNYIDVIILSLNFPLFFFIHPHLFTGWYWSISNTSYYRENASCSRKDWPRCKTKGKSSCSFSSLLLAFGG